MSRRVVIAKIVGGLGNQLFCYAAARRLALANGANLCLDLNFFRSDIYYGRQYRLDQFDLAMHETIRAPRRLPAVLDHYGWRVERRLGSLRLLPGRDCLVERDPYRFEERLLGFRVTRPTVLDGYWQDERYFTDIAPILRKELRFKIEPDSEQRNIAARINAANAVAIHRRLHEAAPARPPAREAGLTPGYYARALREISSRTGDCHLFCFGDDPLKSDFALPGDMPSIFVHNPGPGGEAIDLWLMSQCRHFIVANSSFSWWAAWLGTHPDKVVVAPRRKDLRYWVRPAAGWIEIDW